MKKVMKKIVNLLPAQMKYSLYRSLVKVPTLNLKNVVFKLAETKEELEGAFQVLHDSYVEVGLMKPDPSGMRVTPYHALNSTVTLIGKVDDKIVATLTIIADNKLGLPCDQFIDLSTLRQGGNRIAEISALAIKKEYRGQLLFHLLKYMYEWCVDFLSINHLIATLTTDSKSHELYEAILFFKRIENKIEANYAFSNFRPVIAEHLNLDEAREVFKDKYASKAGAKNLFNFFVEQKSAIFQFPKRLHFTTMYPVMSPEKFSYFFSQKTNALGKMSDEALLALSSIFKTYPQIELINSVLKKRSIYSLYAYKVRNRFDVSVKASAISGQEMAQLRILDVSEHGLRVASQVELNNLTMISVPMPDGTTCKIEAEKVWQDSHGVAGLRIHSAEKQWLRIISDLDENLNRVLGSWKRAA